MGNPEILSLRAGEPVEPPRKRVLWRVYRLRDQGEKLPRAAVLRTGQLGLLVLHQQSDGLAARLIDPSGYPALGSLHQVRVIRNDAAGLLLHGAVLSVKSGTTRELPQAWWCLVERVDPIESDDAAPTAEPPAGGRHASL